LTGGVCGCWPWREAETEGSGTLYLWLEISVCLLKGTGNIRYNKGSKGGDNGYTVLDTMVVE